MAAEYVVQKDTSITHTVTVGTPLVLIGQPLAAGVSGEPLPPLTITLFQGTDGTMTLEWLNAIGGRWQTVPGFESISASTAADQRSSKMSGQIAGLRATALVANGTVEVTA